MIRMRWGIAVAIVLLGVGLRMQAIKGTWFLDDYNQRGLYTGELFEARGPWDLHVAVADGDAPALIEHGVVPWWTHPQLRFAPLRPLTSVLLWWSYETFGEDAAPNHALSLALWALLGLAAAAVFFEVLPPAPALLSLLVFCLARTHSSVVGWVASRGLLLAALFGFLSLWGYLRWRRTGRPWAAGVHVLGLACALGGGEYALSIPAYCLAYELGVSRDAWRRRVFVLVPSVLLCAGYLAWHIFGHYGVRHVLWYSNPLAAPLAFVSVFFESAPSYVAEGLLGLWIPMGYPGFGGWAFAGTVGVVWALSRLDALRPTAGWMLAGGMLAAVPCGLTLFQPRLVLIPKLGLSVAVALLLHEVWQRRAALRRQHAWALLTGAVVLSILNGPLAAYYSWEETRLHVLEQTELRDAVLEADLGPHPDRLRQVFLINSIVLPVLKTAPMTRRMGGGSLVPWRALSPAAGPQRIERLSPTRIELSTTVEALFGSHDALTYRSAAEPVKEGFRSMTDDVTVTVVHNPETGPTTVRYDFDEPLESEHYRFLISTPRGFEPYEPPAVGQWSILPPPFYVDWLCRRKPSDDGRPCQ